MADDWDDRDFYPLVHEDQFTEDPIELLYHPFDSTFIPSTSQTSDHVPHVEPFGTNVFTPTRDTQCPPTTDGFDGQPLLHPSVSDPYLSYYSASNDWNVPADSSHLLVDTHGLMTTELPLAPTDVTVPSFPTSTFEQTQLFFGAGPDDRFLFQSAALNASQSNALVEVFDVADPYSQLVPYDPSLTEHLPVDHQLRAAVLHELDYETSHPANLVVDDSIPVTTNPLTYPPTDVFQMNDDQSVPSTSASDLWFASVPTEQETSVVRGTIGSGKLREASERRRQNQHKWSCLKCGTGFTSYPNAKRHVLAHLNVKPHSCSCGACFTCPSDLRRHRNSAAEPGRHVLNMVDSKTIDAQYAEEFSRFLLCAA